MLGVDLSNKVWHTIRVDRNKERMMTNEQENIMYQMQYTLYGTEEWEILNERLNELTNN